MNARLSKYFGDRAFYSLVLAIALPIMVQNTITNFVNLLDNIMVGQLGTESMSAVAILNQLMFVFNLCTFGAVSGAGIFTAQYYGSGSMEGVRSTFRYKLYSVMLLLGIAFIVFLNFGDALIGLYLSGSDDGSDRAAVLAYARQYLNIMLIGMPAFVIAQVYSDTLKECGETMLPMRAGLAAVCVNLVFNYLLIYGHFGFPRLGVAGAAAATVLSRYVELIIVVVSSHKNGAKYPWLEGMYKSFSIPAAQVIKYTEKGIPVLVNEFLWAAGVAFLNQCYSVRGLNVVAGMNISQTIVNLLAIMFITIGSATMIIVGQQLGAGELEKAKLTDTRLTVFSACVGIGVGLISALIAPYFPLLYNVSPESREIARRFMLAAALFMPVDALIQAAYCTLRCGGKTGITFLFDSGYTWLVNISAAFLLSRFTNMDAVHMYLVVIGTNVIKVFIGMVLVHKDVWLVNIVSDSDR